MNNEKNKTRRLILAIVAATTLVSAAHAQTEGDYLYRITTTRAAPGHFVDYLEALERSADLDRQAGDRPPFVIRHSQGDQWDFMLIYPMGDRDSFHAADREAQRATVWERDGGVRAAEELTSLTAYREDWFARSVRADELARRFDGMGLFHVEMFAGLPGGREELLEQRRMENRYYEALERQQNVIFVRESGPNWDAMTIGFHENLQSFAEAGSRFSEAEQEEAARAAGFAGVNDIGPYLRSLLSYHHDTLGVPAR